MWCAGNDYLRIAGDYLLCHLRSTSRRERRVKMIDPIITLVVCYVGIMTLFGIALIAGELR